MPSGRTSTNPTGRPGRGIRYCLRGSSPGTTPGSQSDLRADDYRLLAGQLEGVDRARRVPGHPDEQPLAPSPHRWGVGGLDRGSRFLRAVARGRLSAGGGGQDRRNERDRSGETKTSGDQSNSSADLKITQAIRQALMKDSELSTTAKNIKIITANGQVTLRGPVKTAQEKAKVDQIARSAAGGAQIDDQLDVKGSK